MASTFLEALKQELDLLRWDNARDDARDCRGTYGDVPVYEILPNFNLGKWRNNELAWTLNTNNSLPNWMIQLGN